MDEAQAQLAETAKLGIDVETLATRLQEDGLKQFEDAFAKTTGAPWLKRIERTAEKLKSF